MTLQTVPQALEDVSDGDTKPLVTAHETIAPIEEAMQNVETAMRDALDSDVTVLREASHHIVHSGGKRVRPRLLLLAYAAAGGTDLDLPIPVAAAVELVHTASVVHDDINDHGVVRRGRPSVNALWGRTFALLTGDFLFTKVYELMAPHKDLNIILAEATVALVEGETLQAAAVKENRFTKDVYYQIIARKTAALFSAASRIGAEMADATPAEVAALTQFGFNVGLAFQIVDDILDLIGDQEALGKTAGIDLEQGKGFAATYSNGTNGTTLQNPDDPVAAIKRKALQGNAINEAREQAQQLIKIAVEGLDTLTDSPEKDALIELAYLVIERNR
jgi:octaprenyl-diphosphate synthase